MKIDFMEERDTFLGYCLINSVTHKYKDKEMDLPKTGEGYNVQFIVNGVELPLHETFKDIENQIDRMVEEKAFELIKEKFADIENILTEITECLKEKARERLNLKTNEGDL